MAVVPTALDRTMRARYAFRPVVVTTFRLPPLARYGVAIATTVAVVLLNLWLGPTWIARFPFVVIMPAVMLSGWVGGLGPGLLSTLLLAAASLYYWIEPVGSWAVNEKTDLLGVIMFVVVGAVISALNEAWRRSVAASGRSEEQLSMMLQREREAHADLQRTADQLRQAEERFRIAIESAPTTMLLMDRQGMIVFANTLSEQLLGYGPHELIGRQIEHFLPPRFRDQHAHYRRHFFANPTRRPMGSGRDLYALRKDGSEVPVEIGLSPIETTDGLFVLAAVTDISERKRAEKVLRARTEELERVLEVIPASVWIAKDPECREIIGNRSAAAMLGIPLEQNVSQTPTPGDNAVPLRHFRDGCELSPDKLPLQRAAATGSPQPAEELEIELRDGRRVALIGSAAPLMDEYGQVRGAVAAFSDITERKQADQHKDEFLALLGHELRNPLAPIGTATELLSRTLPADSRAQLALDIIKRQATQLTRLVDDLLDMGRITQGLIQLQQMPLELANVIAQAVETVEPKLHQKRHEISISRSEVPLYVHGDFARLVQCVANVLANAVKYTEPHGKICIETRAEVEVAAISISDNGTGIPPDLLPKVFDLFVQGDRTLDRAEGGLGIGLAVVKRLIHMHRGEVTVQSGGLGKGTTIEIRLPRIAQPAATKSPATTSVNISPRRILVVDDNADFAQSLAMLLSTAGHQIEVALGGRQALVAIESFAPEVALVDIGLPEMNGYELALRLRADATLNGLKLVAVTGYGQVEDRQRARTAGFDHHLLKPIDIAALELMLATMCSEAADEPGNQLLGRSQSP